MIDKKQEETVKITPFRKENSVRIYSNYVRVVSNPFEITLQFADIKPGVNDEEQDRLKKEKSVRATIDTEIILPIEIAKKFLEILQKQLSLIKVNSDKTRN